MPRALRIRLTKEEKQQLYLLSSQAKTTKRTKTRIEMLKLSARGWKVEQIAHELNCAPATVRRTIARWLEFFCLSSYSPELNHIEPEWHQLKTHELAGRMFEDEDELAQAVIKGIEERSQKNNYICQRFRFN
jgi:DNA-binding NarL/FixJ family response regulator